MKRVAMAEVQRAVAVAVAESRASERLRSQRYLDNLPLQTQPRVQHLHGRPSPFLRLSETTARAQQTGNTAQGSATDEIEKEPHLGSVSFLTRWFWQIQYYKSRI